MYLFNKKERYELKESIEKMKSSILLLLSKISITTKIIIIY